MFFNAIKKRRTERVKPLDSHPIEIQIMSNNSIDILRAFDISIKGVGVRIPTHYELDCSNKNVDLVITLPGSRPFQATGIVRHISTDREKVKPCFGVEFTRIADSCISNIKSYMLETKENRISLAS